MSKQTECWEKLDRLKESLIKEFGPALAERIFTVLKTHLYNDRIIFSVSHLDCLDKHHKIFEAKARGYSYEEIANQSGYTWRHVRRLLNPPKRAVPKRQPGPLVCNGVATIIKGRSKGLKQYVKCVCGYTNIFHKSGWKANKHQKCRECESYITYGTYKVHNYAPPVDMKEKNQIV